MKTLLIARSIIALVNARHATEATLRALGRSGARLKSANAEARGGAGVLESEWVGSEGRIEALENIASSLRLLPGPVGSATMSKPGAATHRVLISLLSRDDLDRALVKIGDLSQIEKISIDDLSGGKGRHPVYTLKCLTVIDCSLALASLKRELTDFANALRVVAVVNEIRASGDGAGMPVPVEPVPTIPKVAAAKPPVAGPSRAYRLGRTAGMSVSVGALADIN